MNFEEFKKSVMVSLEDICREFYRENRDLMKIKKEDVAVKNFVAICHATLKLSTEKGFQAMSLRDLCGESGLSMGALYSYFSSKEELVLMIHEQGHKSVQKILIQFTQGLDNPLEKLRSAVRAHLYLSELMRYWFAFFFMETKNLSRKDQRIPVESELWTEKLYIDIIEEGNRQGVFAVENPLLAGAAIKALMQDWYLKRWKYAQRKVAIDSYADFILALIESFIVKH
jgi:AcrR family transcriptional regulator